MGVFAGRQHDVQRAVQSADLRVLLMSLHHVTGDDKWLSAPYLPRRDVRIIADETAGLAPDVADEIRAAAVEFSGVKPVIEVPDDERMMRMMAACLGHEVPREYLEMMKEEMGFASRDVEVDPSGGRMSDFDALIVGAGPSGIAMSVRLKRLGMRHAIVEKSTSVGGVWRENVYPGCAVDTPNHSYSFSFAPPNRWSRFFAPQPELREYMQRTANEFGVTPHVQFETEVVGARWLESESKWEVELDGPGGRRTQRCTFLITAIGQLHVPKQPMLPGLDSFNGTAFHTARWPEGFDVRGKRIGIIGTGATSMQIVPAIVDDAAQLTVFQRSAQWARPIERYHDPIPDGVQWMLDNYPYYAQWYRFTMTWRFADGLHPYIQKDPTWEHPERSVNKKNDLHRDEMVRHMLSELGDREDLIAKCLPNYPPYGKRILLDNGWFAALRRPHVGLVTERIERIVPTGVVTADGTTHELDTIVLATGFEVTQMASRLNVTGIDGVNLCEVWTDENPWAYLGISVPGFPNMFCLQGPNTGLGHGGSAIFQSECQARHVTACMVQMAER
ncbi:MAG: NAD(P)/FAD-dependent oxidoreductase, partial [Ilumatobacteraceae bacterium]|nr:NAD(P)/FAD-dependent oxidoreductase [Ilumatobacteraceae bacterium]